MKTFIKGKDKDLESTIKRMHTKLEAVGIKIKEVSSLNPLDYAYSLHIHDSECELLFTNGKGACKKSCEASALGEFFERLSCNYLFADYYLGEQFSKQDFVFYPNEKWFSNNCDEMPEGLLTEELWQFFDPNAELLPSAIHELNSGAGERGICALPFQRHADKEEIFFPINFLNNLYVSNGMAAGNTASEAKVQALSEIFERYVKNKIIAEGITLPLIPLEVIESFPHTKAVIDQLETHGFHLRICDASLGGVYPVISVTLINPKDGAVFASFGAHPCFEVALERTVTELLQGRDVNHFDDFQAPTFNLDEVADSGNLETHFVNATGLLSYEFFKEESDYEFVYWNHDSDTSSEEEYLSQIIHDNGFDIYFAEYNFLGLNVCRIIVPGMSEIYPIEDLVWSNNNEGALFRETVLNLKNLDEERWQELFEALEEGGFNDLHKVSEFIGVIPDENTKWLTLSIAELKAMLALALGDTESALEWNRWSLHSLELNDEEKRFHRCLDALLEIQEDDLKDYEEYAPSLALMYSQETLDLCLNIIQKKEIFYGLHSPGLGLEGFRKHQKLLEAYAKLHKAKAEFLQK